MVVASQGVVHHAPTLQIRAILLVVCMVKWLAPPLAMC